MKDPSQGMDHTVPDGGQYAGTDFEMPEDHPELERCQSQWMLIILIRVLPGAP